ncbi:hypothetical protein L9F63_026860, partial [Diploptera punctata]
CEVGVPMSPNKLLCRRQEERLVEEECAMVFNIQFILSEDGSSQSTSVIDLLQAVADQNAENRKNCAKNIVQATQMSLHASGFLAQKQPFFDNARLECGTEVELLCSRRSEACGNESNRKAIVLCVRKIFHQNNKMGIINSFYVLTTL